jgi:class 3 adenylate cyclase
VRPDLPTGTVTFVFTDVEGSTSLLNELGAEAYADAVADHRAVIREACIRNGGVEVDTQGDAFFFAFPTAPGALEAASTFTDHLAANGQIRVRVGVHTARPCSERKGMSATMSTAPLASPPRGTAARCSSRRRRLPWSRSS